MKLRQLNPEEIKVRAQANRGGVKLSLWKVPKANLSVLDDSIGIENRSVSYSDNGMRCTLSVRINGEWLSNDGYAFEGSPDNPPNDALNHAGFAWGIGSELYHAPEIFISKDKLNGYSYDEEKGARCTEDFKVSAISYENGTVTSVTIAICKYGTPYDTMVFKQTNVTPASKEAAPAVKTEEETPKAEATPVQPAQGRTVSGFADDEIILIGNCRGKTYGEVKETETFKSFLAWAKNSKSSYPDAERADQMRRFKEMVAA